MYARTTLVVDETRRRVVCCVALPITFATLTNVATVAQLVEQRFVIAPMSLRQALKQGFFRVFSLVFSLSVAPKTIFKARLHSIIARRLPRANPAITNAHDPLNKPQGRHRDSTLSPAFSRRMWLNISHLLDDIRPPSRLALPDRQPLSIRHLR